MTVAIFQKMLNMGHLHIGLCKKMEVKDEGRVFAQRKRIFEDLQY